MKATVMIRRLKREVLFELPVKRRQQVIFCIMCCEVQAVGLCGWGENRTHNANSKQIGQGFTMMLSTFLLSIAFVLNCD